MAHVDASLLKERPKLPMQRDQPLADKLVLIPILLLSFGAVPLWSRQIAAVIQVANSIAPSGRSRLSRIIEPHATLARHYRLFRISPCGAARNYDRRFICYCGLTRKINVARDRSPGFHKHESS